jgi:Flp pilus assembly pilin Flp
MKIGQDDLRFNNPGKILCELLADDAGQGLLEYSMILAFIAVVAFAALQILGTKNNNSLSNSAHQLPG